MSRRIGVADIREDSIDLAIFEVRGKEVNFLMEEHLGRGEESSHQGLEVWLMVHSSERSIRYVTLPKGVKRQVREAAMMQASPSLPLDISEYAYDVLVKPVGDNLGALVVAIPLEKAHRWEERLAEAGLVLVSFAVEPLFYPLLRTPEQGNSLFIMPTPKGTLALVGCHNGTPVCWKSIRDQSEIPAEGLDDFLVQEYFCNEPSGFKPVKVLAGEQSIEPRLVGFLAAAHLAALSPRPWEGRSLLAFSEFLKREQQAPATLEAVLKCAAVWLIVGALAFCACVALVYRTEKKAEKLHAEVQDTKIFAKQSTDAAKEVSKLRELNYQLRKRSVDKRMALQLLKDFRGAMPDRVRLSGFRFDINSGVRIECVAEKEADIVRFLDRVRGVKSVQSLRLVFAEARDDGLFHFQIECLFQREAEA